MATQISGTAEVIAASPSFECVNTYFLFPFALDKEAIQEDHPEAWPERTRRIDGLDSWVSGDTHPLPQGMNLLGCWKRASYSRFDVESPAYAELLFFTSIVRHVFFDTDIGRQWHLYICQGRRLRIEADQRQLARQGSAEHYQSPESFRELSSFALCCRDCHLRKLSPSEFPNN